jgi:hypothetical protein
LTGRRLDNDALAVSDLRAAFDAPASLCDLKRDLVANDLAHENAKAVVRLHAWFDVCFDVELETPRIGPLVPDDCVLAVEAAHHIFDERGFSARKRRGRNWL